MAVYRDQHNTPIVPVILFSILVHCALLCIPVNLTSDSIKSNKQTAATVSVTISKPEREPANNTATQQQVPLPEPVNSDNKQPEPSPDTAQQQHRPDTDTHRPLNLNLPSDDNSDNSAWPQTPKGGLTANGATVMNGELLRSLNSGGPAKPVSNSDQSYTIHSSAGRGRAHYMRFGDKCFHVVEADPLDSLSHETWWMVKCR